MDKNGLRTAVRDASSSSKIDVTPEMAAKWLEKNESNRPLRKYLINKYRVAMDAGEWMDYASTMYFDNKANLLDGQHRLLAIVACTNVGSIGFHVVRNADPNIVNFIDINQNRNYRDIFTVSQGEVISNAVSQTFLRFISGSYVSTSSDLPWNRQEITELFDKYRPYLEEICGYFPAKKVKGINQACVRAAVARAWVSRPSERARIRQYIDALIYGKHGVYEEDVSALLIRAKLLQGDISRSNGSKGEMEVYRKVEQTLDAFLKRKPISKITVAVNEKFRLKENDLGDLI